MLWKVEREEVTDYDEARNPALRLHETPRQLPEGAAVSLLSHSTRYDSFITHYYGQILQINRWDSLLNSL